MWTLVVHTVLGMTQSTERCGESSSWRGAKSRLKLFQRKYCAESSVICGRLRNRAATTNPAQVVHVHGGEVRKLQRRARLLRPLNASAAAAPAYVAAATSGVAARDTSRSVTGPRRLPRGDFCRSPCGHSAAVASLWNKSFLHR